MEIDLLYFEDCPSWEHARENLRAAAEQLGMEISIHPVLIEDNEGASRAMFQGSPSFQMNGVDFWPEKRARYTMSCRVYRTGSGFSGWPTVEMLADRLKELQMNNQ